MAILPPVNILSMGPSIGPSFSLVSLTFQRAPKEPPSGADGTSGTGEERRLEELFIKSPLVQRDADIFSLLSWHNEISTFVGRDAELRGLHDWAEDPDTSMSMRFVVGPGGIGKTRLAAEFGRAMRKKGWAAGFVNLGNTKSYRLEDKGTLLIIDYPEEQFGQVDQLFKDLAGLRELEALPRLRILFLTRSNFEGWRQRALDSGVTDLVSRTEVAPGQLSAEDAAVLTNSAQGKACKQTVCESLPAPRPFEPSDLERWMCLRPEHKRPLFLVAAGIYSALHPTENVLNFSGPELVMALVDRELTRLRLSSASLGLEKSALPRLLALATIAGGAAWDKVREEWPDLHPLLPAPGDWNGAEQLCEAGWLKRCAQRKKADTGNGAGAAPGKTPDSVPGSTLHLEAVTPDIVGAAFVVKVLSDAGTAAPELAYAGCLLAADPEEFINTLARLDYDARNVLKLEHSLPEWLRLAVEGKAERCDGMIAFIGPKLPYSVTNLGVTICQGLLTTRTSGEIRTLLLDCLANYLADSGDTAAALQAILESVRIRRMQAEANSAHQPKLAQSLIGLSNNLSCSGDTPRALIAIQEAVDIFSTLAKVNPTHFRPNLALSLNNLSNRLAESGDTQAALKAIQDAVEIYRELADENPLGFRPNLAMSLNNLSGCLAYSDDSDAALIAIQEAEDIYRKLAEEHPTHFRPDLAMSLNNLSNLLAVSGDTPGALKAIQDAEDIYRELAEENPARFRPELAGSLHNLSSCLAEPDDFPGALQAIHEAVDIRRKLAEDNPARFRPDLAMSLNNLTSVLAASGDTAAARSTCIEAVNIYEKLANENPARFRPDLARSLGAQGDILLSHGDLPAAAACFKQGLELIQPFAEAHPGTPLERLFLMLKEGYEQARKPDNGAKN